MTHIEFVSSPRPTVGVEMELELINRDTRELVSGAHEILGEMNAGYGDAGHPKAKKELLQSTVEIITGVCETASDIKADLAATMAELREHSERRNLELICSGTHPFSDPALQEISPDPRYLRLVSDMQWPAKQMQIFGIHVHVGVRSGEKAIAIVNPLSASSPYWMGHDTGMASWRSKVFESLPTAGPPWILSGWPQFEQLMDTLISSQTIKTIREVWWDIRPHPGFGTVEIRVCDGISTLREVGVMAALSQCLVHQFDTMIDRGYTLPTPRAWLVRENKWRAARHGLEASIIVDEGRPTVPLRQAIRELVEDLTPVAARLGCITELRGALDIMDRGSSSIRQREVVEAGGSLIDVVDSLIAELHADMPLPRAAVLEAVGKQVLAAAD